MEPFVCLTSLAAPLPEANVDTDIIVPARFLLITEKKGLGRYAFYEWREGGGFVLDDPKFAGAQILVAGDNFGCGSSREHAPWALHDLGIRCIIAPSFGEIFRANCVRNGMLAVTLKEPEWQQVLEAAERGETMSVDLDQSIVHLADGSDITFVLADAEREALLNGWDEIDGIRAKYTDAITDFERRQRETAPWLWEKEYPNG
jgi:3-isopropylmalate dehydratase small subunit